MNLLQSQLDSTTNYFLETPIAAFGVFFNFGYKILGIAQPEQGFKAFKIIKFNIF